MEKNNEIDFNSLDRTELLEVINTEIIYKYASLKVGKDDILLKQTLMFSDPTTFNDPFETHESLINFKTDNESLKKALSYSKTKIPRRKIREIKKLLSDKNLFKSAIEEERTKYKLSCFSKTFNEVLLWSHYANKHSGICIGFDFPPIYNDRFILCPIKYLNQIKAIDGSVNAQTVIRYWLTSKSVRWKYEQEIRAIAKSKNKEKFEFIHFETDAIKEVLFGCKIRTKEINSTIQQLKEGGYNLDNIRFYKMEIDEKNFLLKRIPL